MDLYVERQYVNQIKGGDLKQFLFLLDGSFQGLYSYVFRRVGEGEEANNIIRLTFLDALAKVQDVPTDVSYSVWLYSLVKQRVWDVIERASFPQTQGLISGETTFDDKSPDDDLKKAEKMFKKLSLEEREILRLKFFEEVSDGDVMTILGMEEGIIGPKIYRVLKRAHFLLFGESDEKQGVYFGELSGFLSRIREMEKITIPEAFRLSLRADISNRLDRRDFAVEGEVETAVPKAGPKKPPVFVKGEDDHLGSNDPAKVFVEAVREMKREEEDERVKATMRMEREERLFDFLEKWRSVLTFVPVIIVLIVVGFFVWKFGDFSGEPGVDFVAIERGYPNDCSIEVLFNGDFSDGEKRSVNKGISDRICGHFKVKRLLISRLGDEKVAVKVDVPQWFLEYNFVKKNIDWRIKKYARTFNSYEKSGKV